MSGMSDQPWLLDEDGKAIYGTPGPGTYTGSYKYPTQFVPPKEKYVRHGTVMLRMTDGELGKGLSPYSGMLMENPGSHVFTRGPAYSMGLKSPDGKVFISRSHVEDRRGTQSPGPNYNVRGKPMPQTAKFGTAERAAEQKRFLSDAHAHAALGQRTPGPGYLLSSGKGIPNTFGDAPEWRFSTGPRAEVVPRDAPGTPGPGEYPKELHWEAAGGRFSPVRSRPGTQYRKPGKEEFISHDHFAVDNPEWRHTPGPGRYGTDPLEVESIRSTLRSKAAEVDPALRKLRDRAGLNPDFSKSGKPFDPARSAFISEDLLQRGATDALYDTRKEWASELEKNTRKAPMLKDTFGTAARSFHPELGGNKAGPLISAHHSSLTMTCNAESPGAMYDTEGHLSIAGGKGIKFAQQKRPLGDNARVETAGPGPGAYKLDLPPSPGVKIGARFRNPAEIIPDPESPSPLHYSLPTTVRAPSPTRSQSPTQKRTGTFGYCKDRLSFIQNTPSPGPGADFPREMDAEELALTMASRTGKLSVASGDDVSLRAFKSKMKGYSIGLKTRSLVQYISHSHAQSEKRGMHSPGPKYHPGQMSQPSTKGPRGGKDPARPRSTFGFSTRDSKGVYMGRAFKYVKETTGVPGPGAYDVHNVPVSKVKYNSPDAGTKFGTSVRPMLATVKF